MLLLKRFFRECQHECELTPGVILLGIWRTTKSTQYYFTSTQKGTRQNPNHNNQLRQKGDINRKNQQQEL